MSSPTYLPAWRRRAAIVLCAALVACSADGKNPVQPVPPGPELPAGVYALNGIGEGLARTDLEPYRRIVGDARFVALGESYHTSHGFSQAKVRLIKFMVEQMGFRVVALESPWLQALPATRYVASCTGTPELALASLNAVWHDSSLRELLRWMCDYNRQHPADPVSFFGFDIQEPGLSAPAVRQLVQRAAPAELARTEPLLSCLGATHEAVNDFYRSRQYLDHVEGRRDAAANQRCMSGIADVEGWMGANAGALAASTSAAAVEEARIALVALRAWQEQLWVPDPGGYQARDYGMSRVLRQVHALHTPGKKTAIWAWNWHISRRYEEVRGWNDDPGMVVPRQGARNMGSFLHEALGPDYLPIGLIGYRVEIRNGTSPPVPTNPLGVEWRLQQLGPDHLLVDLRQPLPATLLPNNTVYPISNEWADPYRQFGALLFLEHSPPMS